MAIVEQLREVQETIRNAERYAGRSQGEVELIAVSKTHPVTAVLEAYNAGQTIFGESRVQEAKSKIESCIEPVDWHLIGHLQSNKCKDAVKLFKMIHSVDSEKLIAEINKRALNSGKITKILLQVNVSGEDAKFGMDVQQLPRCIDVAMESEAVQLCGLMTIPPFSPDPEHSRRFLAELRNVAEKHLVQSRLLSEKQCHLSMGMSGDYLVAIEEGATLVRIGTAIFGVR